MNGFNLSDITDAKFGNVQVSELYFGSTKIWPLNHDYSRDYFTIEALESGSITWTDYSMYRYILYSLDNGNTWQQLNHEGSISSLNAGDKIMFKSDTDYYGLGNYGGFTRISLHFNVYGNAMSLIYGDDFIGKTDFNYSGAPQLADLFLNSNVVDASNLILPALTMLQVSSGVGYNYDSMFYGCSSLIAAPALPATTLADHCYSSMFSGCTSLTLAPALPATTLATYCYNNMFNRCTLLNYVKCLATNISATGCLNNWLQNVSSTGTFVKYVSTTWPSGNSGIPTGWTVQNEGHDYSQDYLTFEALEAGSFGWTGTFGRNIYYSINDGSTWTYLASGSSTPTLNANDKILFKGTDTYASSDTGIGKFSSSGQFNVMGNIMSLIYGDTFINNNTLNNYQFRRLFNNCSNLVNASNLILPATTLAQYCYQYMFQSCSSLTSAPALPATTLANYCYQGMFYGCSSLTSAPALPATTLAQYCYQYMFQSCSSLTSVPALPATTLAISCYYSMFQNCTSLVTAPELPATTLAQYCYQYMFSGCTSLTIAPELPATTLAIYCYASMFSGCTSLTLAPALPATTLANYCYAQMFDSCTSLTTAPELPATTLASYCYKQMFNNCSMLNYVKCLATMSLIIYTDSWLNGVSATGTFVKYANTYWDSGDSGIPVGWTVQSAS